VANATTPTAQEGIPMASICYTPIRGDVLRVTRLNECCVAESDPCGQVVTDGYISVAMTAEVEEPTEVLVKNAKGAICSRDKGCTALKEISVVITLCNVDAELINLLTGNSTVLDFAGLGVGFEETDDLFCDGRFGLELWAPTTPGVCTDGVTPRKRYAYFVLPCLSDARITGDITLEDGGAVSLEISASTTIPNAWGVGPNSPVFDVIDQDAAGTPGKQLVALNVNAHRRLSLTSVPPPEAACGCIPLVITP
jgi:hypothetical protein